MFLLISYPVDEKAEAKYTVHNHFDFIMLMFSYLINEKDVGKIKCKLNCLKGRWFSKRK